LEADADDIGTVVVVSWGPQDASSIDTAKPPQARQGVRFIRDSTDRIAKL
jgi:hypothetical protein